MLLAQQVHLFFLFLACHVVWAQSASHLAARDVNQAPTTLRLSRNDAIRDKDTLQRAIDGGRSSLEKGKRTKKLQKLIQTADDCYDVAATNVQNAYTIPVVLGQDRAPYTLLLDTGSSVTWVGADQTRPYHVSDSTQSDDQSVAVTYGSGSFSGELYNDTLRLGDLLVTNQGIAGATTSQGMSPGVDGILGVGPSPLSRGTVSPDQSRTVLNVVDTAFDRRKISTRQLGVYFEPTISRYAQNGEVTIGGIDYGRTKGSLMWTPRSRKPGAVYYWGVDLAASVCGEVLFSDNGGIVDTGTTAIYFASDAFQAYADMIPGAVVDPSTGLLQIPKSSLDSIPDINFELAGTDNPLVFNRYAQLFDPSVQGVFGLSDEYYYSWIVDLGRPTGGNSYDFILGQKFLERYYSVYDSSNWRIGFSRTEHSEPQHFA